MARDKEAEDETEKNTTHVKITKNRLIGDTGEAGKIYYDKLKHVMYDFDTYFGLLTTQDIQDVQVKATEAIDEEF
jgi:hypothetical protein